MTVDHEVSSGGDGAARAESFTQIVIMFAIYLSCTCEAVSARRAASQAHGYWAGVDGGHRSAPVSLKLTMRRMLCMLQPLSRKCL